MKKLIAVVMSVLLLVGWHSANASSLVDMLDRMDYDMICYVKQKVDERYEELKKQKEKEENSATIEWVKQYFVDNFGDPTDKQYIKNKKYIEGSFSNSATKNSFLCAYILFSPRPEFLLLEYGDLKVTSYGTDYYTISVKTEDGTTSRFTGELSKGNERIVIYKQEKIDEFLEIMKKPQVIKIYIQEQEYLSDSYLFSFNTEGFAELYQEVFEK